MKIITKIKQLFCEHKYKKVCSRITNFTDGTNGITTAYYCSECKKLLVITNDDDCKQNIKLVRFEAIDIINKRTGS